jgi:hypothetical protein
MIECPPMIRTKRSQQTLAVTAFAIVAAATCFLPAHRAARLEE